jgi:hypothetical protein
MRTLRLKQLVNDVLASLPTPHTEDVIEDVFVAIENNRAWKRNYDEMVYESGKATVNAGAGFWISHAEGKVGDKRETATRTALLESYSKLTTPLAKRKKKVKEPEALSAMHEHFQANRDSLPASIKDHRELIVTLIMEGLEAEAAFSKALERPTFAW